MPNYTYIATSFDGKTEQGTQQAIDERHLAQALKGQGLMLVRVLPDGRALKMGALKQFSFSRVSLAEKIFLTKNLQVMLSTGLSLVKSVDILLVQVKNATLKKALTEIKERINTGEALSDSLARYPKIFSALYCNMIKVGEETGTLDNIFQVLVLQLEKEHELKAKIGNALIYPGIIVGIMMVVGVIMVTIVLPNLNTFFVSLNIDIPIHTRIVLAVGNFLSVNWYLLFVLPAAFVAAIYFTLKTSWGKQSADRLLLKTPILAPVIKKSNSAFFVRSLSSLIAAGVPLVKSLEITAGTVKNYYFQEALLQASGKIKKGEELSSALLPSKHIFPTGVIDMIRVGEETGKTSVILKELADFYEKEAMDSIEKMTVVIEPLMIVVMGVGVGIFALSIIQPIYSSLSSINGG